MKRPLLFYTLIFLCSLSIGNFMAQDFSRQAKEKYGDALNGLRNGSCLAFTAIPSSNPVSCNGFDDGEACITVTSGVGPFTYLWFGETSTDSCLSNVDAGSYIVIVTDVGQSASCSWEITVSEPTAIGVIAMNASPPSCVGICDAAANPLVVGGNGGYMFNYDSGETTQAASMLCNPFQLTITDANGCITDTTFVFTNAPDTIQIDAVVTDNICFDELDGEIDITATGGIGSYDFAWTGPNSFSETTEDISGLEPGVYQVMVTDDNGCMETDSFTVDIATEITIDALIVDVVCFGDSTGMIDITVGGGNPDYTYDWTGPSGFVSSTEDISDLQSGTYDLTVTDITGCTKDTSFFVDENPQILISAMVTDNVCFGDSSGVIDITVTSLLGVASYSWVGPGGFTSGSQDISDLISGDYTVTITDLAGCQQDTTISILEPDELQFDFLITDILCNGDSTGAIDLTISGGTPGYSVNWTGPGGFTETAEDINDLVAGDYTVTVTDLNLCQNDTTVTVLEPLAILVVETITDLSCNSDSTGAIEIEISGGTGSYTTSWIGPLTFSSFDEDIFDLQAGFYNLLVEDDNGCGFDALYEVTEPDSLLLDFLTTDLDCAADSSGAIDITVTGGTGSYTYLWSGPGTFSSSDEDISDLQAGLYDIQVEDENACSINESIEIFEPVPLSFDTLVTDISCAGIDDGEIDLEITGGTGLYDIQWTGPGTYTATTEDIDSLAAGIYTVVVTDENFCSDSLDVEIIEPGAIDVMGLVTDVECNGDMNGEIDITVTLGAGGYTFDWVGPGAFTSTDEDLTDLFGGVYVVTVTDTNMCSAVSTFEVEQNQEIIIDALVDQIDCAGDSTGAISVTVSGGQGPYIYSWTGPSGFTSNQEDISNLIAGTYTLTVEDILGCTEQETFFISEPLALDLVASVQDPLCFGEENGDIDIAITGGTPDYFIEWVGPSGFNESGIAIDIDNLEAGDYDLTITDLLGCTIDTTFTLVEPDDLEASLDLIDPGCDLDNGSAVSTVSGGTVAVDYTYYWLNSIGDTIGSSFDLTGLGAGTYTFIVLDDNDCRVSIPFELSDDVGTISALIDDVSCFNEMDGAIDVEITGLSGSLDIDWVGPGSYTATTIDISGLEAGDYTISIEDDLGCTLVETYTVDSPDEIVIFGNVTNESCEDLEDGQIDITVTGGQGALTYSWTDGGAYSSSDEDILDLAPGTYTVTVTDTSSCSNQQSFDVLPAVDYLISGSITDIDCAGDMNGAIDISSVPILIGATYSWDGPGAYTASTEDIIDLGPGLYILTTVTTEFCLLVDSFMVSENDSLIADLVTSPSVCGSNTGSASLTVTGGEAAVDYIYSFYSLPDSTVLSTTSSVGFLDGGLYGYTVTDDNGCQTSGSFTISDDFGTLDAAVQGVTCEGEDDGSIELTITGLSGMLTISWVGPNGYTSSDEDIFDLEAGSYTVTITDENGCVLGDTYEVEEGVGILITATVSDISCFEDDNGAIDMEFSGGQSPYDISWTGPGSFTATQEDINDLGPGDYTVSIIDLNGCDGTADFTVSEPDLLDVDAFITPVVCNGDFTGAIEINILGGTGPFDISWTGPIPFTSTFEDISGLEAGLYSLSILDDNNCTFTADYEVLQPDAIEITLLQLVN
ncbi:MAG: hypothetical protein HKN45_10665, partial [Flavobacteriales bacterium]|nr:hypothetical protein [Flavobacteriales bacterium]